MDTPTPFEVTVDSWPRASSQGLTITTASGSLLVRHQDPDALRAELGPGSRLVLTRRPDGSCDLIEHIPAEDEFTIGDVLG